MKKYLSLLIVPALLISACVPSKQYNDLKSAKEACDADKGRLTAENLEYATMNKELGNNIKEMNETIDRLRRDTAEVSSSLARLRNMYDDVNNSYTTMLSESKRSIKNKDEEAKKALGMLETTRDELQKKEDELKKLSNELSQKEDALKAREAKVAELQKILSEKDSATTALRKKVTDALVGFNNNGLTIEQKNGKVYVSMEEKLLFASGSTDVDKKGQEALKQLAKVLEDNKDINVMVEGHTDNVPINGGPIKDNWDLSVLRATSVTKILLNSAKISPTRIIPAGRGEYVPVAKNDSPENKRKNRRIEVILTPKLDEILKVLEN